MRSLTCYISATLLVCSVSAVQANDKKFPDYSMVLVGGGLQTCSSTNTRHCSVKDNFSDAAKSSDLFQLSAANLANIADKTFWGEERVIEQQQTLAILEFVRSRVTSEQISERELLRLWRSAETEMDGIWVSGRTNYAALTERELSFVLDQLQVMVVGKDSAKRSSAPRLKEYADLANTSDAADGFATKPDYRPLTKFENRGLKLGQPAFPQLVGAGGGVGRAVRLPFLKGFVVREFTVPKRRLIMLHRVRAAEEMVARPHLGKGIDGELVVIDLHALKVGMQSAAQVRVQHEFFIGHG